jgi:protein-disulfide isomerase
VTETKKERRARVRAEREERAQSIALKERRRRRLWLLGAVTVLAAVLVGTAVLVSQSGTTRKPSTRQTASLFTGIPQQGLTLGNPKAPLTLQEYADLQCPFCREYTFGALPTVVNRYVRTGKLRIEFRPLAIIGPDSATAARVATAVASQGLFWQFVDRFYAAQQQENSGYVTEDFVRNLAKDVPGLNISRAIADSKSPSAAIPLEEATRLAKQLGINGTPSFVLGRTGGQGHVLQVTSLSPDAFTGPIDQALASL